MQSKSGLFRLPFVFGRITRIDKLSNSAVVYLQDDSGGVLSTLSISFTKKYSEFIAVGTVLVVENVS